MLGWKIFAHSVRMVLRNFKQALQIAVVPGLIGAAVLVGLVALFDIPMDSLEGQQPSDLTGGTFVIFITCALLSLFVVIFWIIVAWHRFVLLEEYPTGVIPPFRFDRITAYFGRLLMLSLVGVLAFVPFGLLISGLAQVAPGLTFLLFVFIGLLLLVCICRLSLILPAAAIGRPLGLGESWQATAGASGAILLTVLLTAVLQILVETIGSLLIVVPIIGIIFVLVASMLIVPLINVSVLTTMYGYFIDGQQLD